MRTVVIAAGDGSRWGDYLGVPKHLVPIDGIPLLEHTVSQFSRYGQVLIAGPDDPRYQVAGGELVPVRVRPEWGDADKFLSSAHLWNPTGRTVVAYGDVWFTRSAVAAIVEPRPGWWNYSRLGPSTHTGCEWGENFAVGFWPDDHDATLAALVALADGHESGRLWRTGGWELYRVMCGLDPAADHADYGRRVEIDDMTDDFDFPEDFDRWLARR